MKLLFTAIIALSGLTVLSQSPLIQPQTQRNKSSIGNFLNPDGTVKSFPTGNHQLNIEGYTMGLKTTGEPFFTPLNTTVAGDEKWDSTFAVDGTDDLNAPRCVAISGNDVYVGGNFSNAGGLAALNIAKWTPSGWSAMGNGIPGQVLDIEIYNGTVYACNNTEVFRWNGTTWTSFGTIGGGTIHPNPTIMSLAFDSSGNLYMSGNFTTINGVTVNCFGKWNGTSWSPLGNGLTAFNGAAILDIAIKGTSIYVCGNLYFPSTGMTTVAKWDGSVWNSIPSTLNGSGGLTTLTFLGDDLYAGGEGFSAINGTPAKCIAKWNGTSWSGLGNGFNGFVNDIMVWNSEIYACGDFTASGSNPLNGIARWDGNTWYKVGNEKINGNQFARSSDQFIAVGGVRSGIVRWNGAEWVSLSNGISKYFVSSITIDGNNMYVGGNFSKVGGINAIGIAKWDGVKWDTLPAPGFVYPSNPFYINDIAVIGNDVYICGPFSTPNFSYIGKWNGTSWSGLGSGVDGPVSAIEAKGTDLYVGGSFNTAGGISAGKIAKWDGTSWSKLAASANSTVTDIKIAANGDVYICGSFTFIGSTTANRVAKWNGSSWSQVGNGIQNFTVSVIEFSPSGQLYAGGSFDVAGSTLANYIAVLNGSTWSGLGSGIGPVSSSVGAIAFVGSDVYVGGGFQTAGGGSARNIARWDGAAWHSLGSGAIDGNQGSVSALAVYCNYLYVGGAFTMAGGRMANNFTRFALGSIPTLKIAGVLNTLCSGSNMNFSTTTSNISGPVNYQWQVNGVNVGTNSPSFSASNLNNNDLVKVTTTGSGICSKLADSVSVQISPSLTPVVTISGIGLDSCSGPAVVLTATSMNGGSTPAYQWQINGVNTGTNSNSLSIPGVVGSKQVKVILTSSLPCVTSQSVNSNILTINLQPIVAPSVSISGNTTIFSGQITTISTSTVNGGNVPLYQWQDSTNASGWKNINGANNATLSYAPTVQGAKLRCLMYSTLKCTSPSYASSNVLSFVINSPTAIVSPDVYNISYGPNPVRQILSIHNLKPEHQWQMAEIFNSEGQKVYSCQIQLRSSIDVDMKQQAPGVYILVLHTRKGSALRLPVIKQ